MPSKPDRERTLLTAPFAPSNCFVKMLYKVSPVILGFAFNTAAISLSENSARLKIPEAILGFTGLSALSKLAFEISPL